MVEFFGSPLDHDGRHYRRGSSSLDFLPETQSEQTHRLVLARDPAEASITHCHGRSTRFTGAPILGKSIWAATSGVCNEASGPSPDRPGSPWHRRPTGPGPSTTAQTAQLGGPGSHRGGSRRSRKKLGEIESWPRLFCWSCWVAARHLFRCLPGRRRLLYRPAPHRNPLSSEPEPSLSDDLRPAYQTVRDHLAAYDEWGANPTNDFTPVTQYTIDDARDLLVGLLEDQMKSVARVTGKPGSSVARPGAAVPVARVTGKPVYRGWSVRLIDPLLDGTAQASVEVCPDNATMTLEHKDGRREPATGTFIGSNAMR